MKIIKAICVSLISCLLLSLMFINSGSAQITTKIKVERLSGAEPVQFTGRAGGSFDLRIKIYDAGYWGVDDYDVYAWQVMIIWNNALLEWSTNVFGNYMNVPREGPWGVLTADAPAGQNKINVTTGSFFAIPSAWGQKVLLQDDDSSEIAYLHSDPDIGQQGNMLVLAQGTVLANDYTVAKNAVCYPWPTLQNVATLGPAGNRIMIGQSTKGAPPGVQGGSGWLCDLSFNVLAEGEVTLDIDGPMGFGSQTYITNTKKVDLGDAPSGAGDPGNYQSELLKESGEFILPWDEDIDGDGTVGIFDLSSVAIWFGEDVPPAPELVDLNNDNHIGIADLSSVSIEFLDYYYAN